MKWEQAQRERQRRKKEERKRLMEQFQSKREKDEQRRKGECEEKSYEEKGAGRRKKARRVDTASRERKKTTHKDVSFLQGTEVVIMTFCYLSFYLDLFQHMYSCPFDISDWLTLATLSLSLSLSLSHIYRSVY